MTKRKKKKNKPTLVDKWKSQLKERAPILIFCLGLVFIMSIYYWFYNQDFFNENINKPVLEFYSQVGSGTLNIFGMETKSHETFISSNEFTLNVGKGCDALSPLVLLLAGILTFPITFKYKIPALVVAPIAVFILNLVRIFSLYFIGLSLPDFFEIAHVEIWQTLFIVACLIGWLYWLIWATKKQTHENT